MRETDFIIVGAGIIGLSITRELVRRFPGARILVLEKEAEVAFHASGRNSGVLHAGFYYSADSLKARFTLTGNQLLTDMPGARVAHQPLRQGRGGHARGRD
jgi:L-2-hydroxyglutarate oxidase LhgO